MEQQQTGSKAYLISIVMVAVLGGLLFGYDTAVISGAEKGLQAFFMEAGDFSYTDGWHGFTSASALIGCIIGSALSGMLATNLGRKKSLIIAGLLILHLSLRLNDSRIPVLRIWSTHILTAYHVQHLSRHRRYWRRIGICYLSYVYWRSCPLKH